MGGDDSMLESSLKTEDKVCEFFFVVFCIEKCHLYAVVLKLGS